MYICALIGTMRLLSQARASPGQSQHTATSCSEAGLPARAILVSAQARVAWHKLLTSHLDGVTKLVGPVVSCEGTPFKGNAASTWKTNPHVQSYTIAMDRVRPSARPWSIQLPCCLAV